MYPPVAVPDKTRSIFMTQAAAQDQEIHEAMLALAKDAGIGEEQFAAMRDAIGQGATLADVFNISKDAMESGYAFAYNLYTAGNYKDAETMFRGLCLYDGDDPRFWMGLAGCLQARGEYALAVDTYGMAGWAGALQDPAPFFHGGLCYLKMGDVENAAASFKAALGLGNDANPAHKACHEKVEALISTLSASEGESRS